MIYYGEDFCPDRGLNLNIPNYLFIYLRKARTHYMKTKINLHISFTGATLPITILLISIKDKITKIQSINKNSSPQLEVKKLKSIHYKKLSLD